MNFLTNEINKKFGNRYDFLKCLDVIFDYNAGKCEITFIYPENINGISDENRTELHDFIKNKLSLNSEIQLKFKKSYLDIELIEKEVIGYVSEKMPIIFSTFRPEELEISKQDDNIKIKFSIAKNVFDTISLDKTTKTICDFLESRFCGNFSCDISSRNNLSETIIEEKRELIGSFNEGIKTPRYQVFDVFKIIGNEITPQPEYIKNIKTPKDSVILAGKISNFRIKTYISKKKANEEKVFYTFSLNENSAKINCIYFCSKTNIPKMEKLVDGTKILVLGNVKQDFNGLCVHIRSISFCEIPEILQDINLSLPTAYETIFPEKIEYHEQENFLKQEIKYNDFIKDNCFVVFDVETTGLEADKCEIIEIGGVKIDHGKISEKFQTLVKPKETISQLITEINGIDNEMVKNAPIIEKVIRDFHLFSKNCILSGYNVGFDMKFIQIAGRNAGLNFDNQVYDVFEIARNKVRAGNYKLGTIVKALNLTLEEAHRAFNDAFATSQILLKLSEI